MFDLAKEVKLWSQSLKQIGCVSKSTSENNIDELIDHLYCEIEALQKEGLSEQEAFEKAVEQFGESGQFLVEQGKVGGSSSTLFHSTGLAQLHKLEKKIAPKSNQQKIPEVQILLISILFAIAMIVTPLVISDKNLASMISNLLYAASATFILLLSINNRHSLKCEYLWIKRNLSKLWRLT